MTTANNPVVAKAIDAINSGDRAAFVALFTPGATMSDDGSERDLEGWIDREIFDADGHFRIQSQDPDGLTMLVRFTNSTYGAMNTRWHFVLSDDGASLRRFETGQT
ncbi:MULTISPECIES: nuclear transport factor 2 family protein [Nonomuraea]|uniref:Nuclear transport factor 2 family protein n=1 Tax=Nonomuraea mangrovi TaxID=2316207 RepID=A0ABW4T7Q6_9ACTN